MIRWETLERWSPTAFLLAGGLLAVFAVLVGLEVFLGVNAPQALVAVPGLLAGFVGLFGLYPRLADADSRFALGGVAVLSLAGISLLVILLWVAALTATYGIDSVKPPAPIILTTIVLAILGYVLVGVASVRAAVPSRTVGLLVLAPPATLALMVLTGILSGGNPPGWTSFLFSGLQAVAHLGIGYVLRTERRPGKRTDATGDMPA